jgi:hypothetical protein
MATCVNEDYNRKAKMYAEVEFLNLSVRSKKIMHDTRFSDDEKKAITKYLELESQYAAGIMIHGVIQKP